MKKITALILAFTMVLGLSACGSSADDAADTTVEATNNGTEDGSLDFSNVKAGFICLHDENSTYDLNFINAAKEACANLGVEYIIRTNIPESDGTCYNTACELVDEGCNFIFADSFGHETEMIQAAEEFPEVQFAHATGTMAHTQGLDNFHNAFATIFQGRYLAGIAAGMKINEMIENGEITADQAKVGYVGAYTYAEVISGYTSFFLGVRSVVPTATMEVTFTGSWYDEAAEKEGAQTLINDGCILISQHADSMGAPTACEEAGVPNVSYNGSTEAACPNTFIVSSRINWVPYFEYALTAIAKGENFATDWTGNIETGSVALTSVGAAATAGTQDAIDAAKEKLNAGTLHVFDNTTFTVGGAKLDSYTADVDTDANYEGDHEVIVDGYFDESGANFRSAPFFDVQIDGITLLNSMF